MGIIYLKKANDDLVSHCDCEDGRISFPPQMDCPWCGCGWLFTCLSCRKAFAFAQAVELDITWEELAHEDWKASGFFTEFGAYEVNNWVSEMKQYLSCVTLGQTYVSLDGGLFSTEARDIDFEGIYARHHFERLPHMEGLVKPALINKTLANTMYWRARRLEAAPELG